MKSESIVNLVKAVLAVMGEVKGIDKTMTIGSGNNTYKGVPDQEVKKIVGESMQKNGLVMLPIGIEESTQLTEWDEKTQYGDKRKQSIFTKVKTSYLLSHTSGEFVTVCGYGHGIDSQDKGAGKATTYALKYALLYSFLVPTGKIDDTDTVHSDSIEVPAKPKKVAETAVKSQPEVKEDEAIGKKLVKVAIDLETADTRPKIDKIFDSYPELKENYTFRNLCNNAVKKLKPAIS